MKIYSKFKEPYDSGLRYFNEDNGIIWHRDEQTLLNYKTIPNAPAFSINAKLLSSDKHPLYTIGFCGKYYPFMILKDSETLKENIEYYFHKPELFEVTKQRWIHSKYFNYSINEYISELMKLDLFKKFNTPLVLIIHNERRRTDLFINPKIKNYEFSKIFDPYLMFQELEMFISNVLTNNNTPEMPVGSDKVIAESKGYDKWSFRKMSNKGK